LAWSNVEEIRSGFYLIEMSEVFLNILWGSNRRRRSFEESDHFARSAHHTRGLFHSHRAIGASEQQSKYLDHSYVKGDFSWDVAEWDGPSVLVPAGLSIQRKVWRAATHDSLILEDDS
jgi:hypothetical protein